MELQESKRDSKFVLFFKQTRILLRSIPSPVVALFVVSVIAMNILANKTLVQTEYLAIDGGILISWLSFLCTGRRQRRCAAPEFGHSLYVQHVGDLQYDSSDEAGF